METIFIWRYLFFLGCYCALEIVIIFVESGEIRARATYWARRGCKEAANLLFAFSISILTGSHKHPHWSYLPTSSGQATNRSEISKLTRSKLLEKYHTVICRVFLIPCGISTPQFQLPAGNCSKKLCRILHGFCLIFNLLDTQDETS